MSTYNCWFNSVIKFTFSSDSCITCDILNGQFLKLGGLSGHLAICLIRVLCGIVWDRLNGQWWKDDKSWLNCLKKHIKT